MQSKNALCAFFALSIRPMRNIQVNVHVLKSFKIIILHAFHHQLGYRFFPCLFSIVRDLHIIAFIFAFKLLKICKAMNKIHPEASNVHLCCLQLTSPWSHQFSVFDLFFHYFLLNIHILPYTKNIQCPHLHLASSA